MKKKISILVMLFGMCILIGCESNGEKVLSELSSESLEIETKDDVMVSQEIMEEDTSEIKESAETFETEELKANSVIEEEEIETVETKLSYTSVQCKKYARDNVNLRDMPSTNGEVVGSLEKNQEVEVIAQCNETGWYQIEWSEGEVYVSDKYLIDKRMETEEQNRDVSYNGDIIEQLATALNNDDYILLNSLAEQYESYAVDIEQYVVKTTEENKYYQLPSSIGTITLVYKDEPSYGINVVVGMMHNDMATGEAKAEEQYQFDLRNAEYTRASLAKYGITNYEPRKYQYGVDMLMEGDEFIWYHHACYINNFKYTELFVNGLKYDSIEMYQSGNSAGRCSLVGF